MVKKIKSDQLQCGMFIHDLNCGWLDHPFVKNKFKVSSDAVIKKIIDNGIREVYIDTGRGLDVIDAPTAEDVRSEIHKEMNKVADAKPEIIGEVPLKEELVRAREIKKEAKKTIHGFMDEVRFGGEIRTGNVERVVEKMVDSIFCNADALLSLTRIREKDEYTYMHSMGVCILMISFGKHLGFDSQQLREVVVGGMLHDVGKMKVPQDILLSDRKLSDKEFEKMREHVVFSRTLLEQTHNISAIATQIAAEHHERADGTGYPEGLTQRDISLYGQAVAIVDVYDAMTSKRAYQRRFPPTEVLGKLYEWSEHHFNKDLVQKFIRCVGIYPVGSLVQLESGLLGLVLGHGEESLKPLVRVIYDTKTKTLIMPYDVDLSNPGNTRQDRVSHYASFDQWNINPETYLH